MPNTYKFPNGGYDVIVLRKQDILNTIDDNIIDKEVALAVIKQCEVDASNFLKEGKWAGIPFLGNIRIPKHKLVQRSKDIQELIQSARENMDSNKYILFRRELAGDIQKKIARKRFFDYTLSKVVTKNTKLFRRYCETHGESYSKVLFFTLYHMTIYDNNTLYGKW